MAEDSEKNNDEDYELIPRKEIEDLRKELRNLKEFDAAPAKTMTISASELSMKIDRLLAIFDDTLKQVKLDDQGIDSLSKLAEKIDKLNEQQIEIAKGMVSLGDLVSKLNDKMGSSRPSTASSYMNSSMQNQGMPNLPPMPPSSGQKLPPLPPLPPK